MLTVIDIKTVTIYVCWNEQLHTIDLKYCDIIGYVEKSISRIRLIKTSIPTE